MKETKHTEGQGFDQETPDTINAALISDNIKDDDILEEIRRPLVTETEEEDIESEYDVSGMDNNGRPIINQNNRLRWLLPWNWKRGYQIASGASGAASVVILAGLIYTGRITLNNPFINRGGTTENIPTPKATQNSQLLNSATLTPGPPTPNGAPDITPPQGNLTLDASPSVVTVLRTPTPGIDRNLQAFIQKQFKDIFDSKNIDSKILHSMAVLNTQSQQAGYPLSVVDTFQGTFQSDLNFPKNTETYEQANIKLRANPFFFHVDIQPSMVKAGSVREFLLSLPDGAVLVVKQLDGSGFNAYISWGGNPNYNNIPNFANETSHTFAQVGTMKDIIENGIEISIYVPKTGEIIKSIPTSTNQPAPLVTPTPG